ncbi:hypothetical protein E3P78_02123 [Wallemia ichthyophaga]|nr:hypothetical protein E3P78_02123 [Wallemia ichthyophaga]
MHFNPDQHSTDYMKAFNYVPRHHIAITFGGLSGRLDQTVHTLSYTRSQQNKRDRAVYVISENNIAWSLSPGTHHIRAELDKFGECCGILPIATKWARVTTQGLEWDLGGPGLEVTGFDGIVSSSNHLKTGHKASVIHTQYTLSHCIQSKYSFIHLIITMSTHFHCKIPHSKLAKVTLFDGKAQVHREFKPHTRIYADTLYTLKLSSLPETLDAESLHVSVGGHEIQVLQQDQSEDREESETTLNIRDIAREIEAKELGKSVVHHQMETLRSFGQKPASTDDLDKYLSMVYTKMSRYHAHIKQLEDDIASSIDHKRALEQSAGIYGNGYGDGVRKSKVCTLSFKPLANIDKVTFTISYCVFNASWRNFYRVKADNAAIQVDYIAKVYNDTGENWEDTTLVLSTSTPNLSAEIPELRPINAQIRSPYVIEKESLAAENMVYRAMPAMVATSSVQNNTISTAFTINGLTTILSNSHVHKTVKIDTISLQADLNWVFVPSLSDRAYLEAEVANTTDMPLLGGEALIFMDGELVSRSYIPEAPSATKFQLSLGVDRNMKTHKKHNVDRYNGIINKGLLDRFNTDTKMQSRSISTVYEVHNMRQQIDCPPAQVVIRDQVPVSVDERVRVLLNTPKELARDKDDDNDCNMSENVEWIDKQDGFFTWRFPLENTYVHDVCLDYEIQWPANEELEV